jgi:hypothetical protein
MFSECSLDVVDVQTVGDLSDISGPSNKILFSTYKIVDGSTLTIYCICHVRHCIALNALRTLNP